MVDQATVSPNGTRAKGFGRNLTGFAHDVATLADLQVRLLAVDARDATKTLSPAAAFVATGAVLALGAIPLLLGAGAFALVEFADWTYTASFGAVGMVSVLGAGLCLWLGWSNLVKSIALFDRSRVEFLSTLQWLKDSLSPDRG